MTSEKLLSIPAFFCGVRHISDCMASLPIRVKKEVAGGGREIAQSHWLNDLFRSPNHYMSWYDYLSWSITQLCVYNNSYSQIERMENGRTSELYPVPANFVQTLWQMPERTPKYNIMQSPTTEFASQMDGYYMLHLKGITLDGVAGMNPLLYASDNTSISVALDEYCAAFFGNSCNPSGHLKVSGILDDTGKQNLKKSFRGENTGTKKTGNIPILEEGIDWIKDNDTNDSHQMLESRKFQLTEMARWLKIPVSKLSQEKLQSNNLEILNTAFVSETIVPLCKKYEGEFHRQLLSPNEQDRYTIEFDISHALRADSKTRYANHSVSLGGSPFKAKNEVRIEEGLPRTDNPEDDIVQTPLNMTNPQNPASVIPTTDDMQAQIQQELLEEEDNEPAA